MNSKIEGFFKSVVYTISANVISLLITVLTTLFLPKFLGVEDFSFWQLYLFYIGYIGLLHFGWNDGLYLRYGGKKYSELDRNLFFSQFVQLLLSQTILAVLLGLIAIVFDFEDNKRMVLLYTAVAIVIVNSRYMLLYILQSTYRMRHYSIVTIIEKLCFAFFLVSIILMELFKYKYVILLDLSSKLISFSIAIFFCREIVVNSLAKFQFNLKETLKNINVGIKLMFSNIASKLMIGNIRFGIEQFWSIIVFGKVSLMLSVAGFVMIFINAISLVLFPFLRRIKEESLIRLYPYLRSSLMGVLFVFLLIYFPLKYCLNLWLPEYKIGIDLLLFLFPMCLFEGKMALLINTYLKVLRKEKLLMIVNFSSLAISIVLSFIAVVVLHNLNLSVLTITVVVMIRSFIAEIYLTSKMNINIYKKMLFEVSMVVIFITSVFYLEMTMAIPVYILALIVYLLIHQSDLRAAINFIKKTLKREEDVSIS